MNYMKLVNYFMYGIMSFPSFNKELPSFNKKN